MTCQHCRLNAVSLAPRIWYVTHWFRTWETVAARLSHLRLVHHPLASCINSMTQHATLWQPPLFRVALISFFNIGASKWSELTHYFLPSRTHQKQTSQGHVRMAKHIRHVHIWPCFSSTTHMAVILALWVIIWVISRDTSASCPWREPVWPSLLLGRFFLLIQSFLKLWSAARTIQITAVMQFIIL